MLLTGFTDAIAQVAMPDTVCIGTSRLYHVNDATIPSTYTWKINGVTQSTTTNEIPVNWTTAGIFTLSVQEHSANGCDGDPRSGLVYVNPLPIANAGPDATICIGNKLQLNGSGGTIYQWLPANYLSNANVSKPFVISAPVGTLIYSLTVSDANGCKSLKSDSVVIKILPAATVFAGRDTSIAINQPLQLKAVDVNNAGFTNYLWSPSSGLNNSLLQNPVAITDRDITYTVTATSAGGCTATDDIKVKVFLAPEIYVPNAFVPRGANNVLKPILVGIKQLKYFAVYNRYGQQVFITSIQGEGWDGTVNGKLQNTGAFAWMVEGIDYKGNTIKKEGMAILIQ